MKPFQGAEAKEDFGMAKATLAKSITSTEAWDRRKAREGAEKAPEAEAVPEAPQESDPQPKRARGSALAPDGPNSGDLCVFALRVTKAERDAIHKRAGRGGASRFARRILVAAAAGDTARLAEIIANCPGKVT